MIEHRPLPDGWRWATLGEVCVQDRVGISGDDPQYPGLPYLGLEHIEAETGRILVSERAARLSDSKSHNFRFTAQHVLYGKLRPYLNKVAIPEFDGRCTTEIIPLLPTEADREWLAWFLRRKETVEYAMRGKTGSRMPRTAMRDFLQLSLPLPPLAEQRRIAGVMGTVERARAAAAAQLAAIEGLTSALLRNVFPSSPAALPRGWRSVPLGEVCRIVNGSTPKSGIEEYWGGDICWITPSDLGSLDSPYIAGSSRGITVAGYESCSTTLVPPGSVILSSRAPIGHLGIAAVPTCTNQGCKSLVPSGAVNSEFLYIALRHFVDDLRELGAGATFAEVSKRTIAAFTIPLPPLAEQHHIAGLMGTAERARAAAKGQVAAVDDLSESLLQQSFAVAA